MSLQQAKNALVASLFELSNAATNAASATVDFYKQAGLDGAETAGSELKDLSASVAKAADSVASTLTTLTNGTAVPSKKTLKRKASFAKPAPENPPAEAAIADLAGEKALTTATSVETPVISNVKADETSVEKSESEKGKPEKKKRKVEKDPNAPKKPLTSYLRFNLQVRESMRNERAENNLPTLPATELNQIISDKWANLTNEDKTALQQAYDKEYEAYKVALEKYKLEKKQEPVANGDAEAAPSTPASSQSTATPKKKAASKPKAAAVLKTPSKAKAAASDAKTPSKPEETTSVVTKAEAKSEPQSETKPEKKKKAKVPAADVSSPASAAPTSEDGGAKKKKKKEKDSDDKKLKKKKSE